MLATQHSLDDAVFDFLEQKDVIVAQQPESLPESTETLFGASSIVGGIGVVLEVGVILVQTVVSQVDVLLLAQVSVATLVVLLSCKAGQSVFVDVKAQRVD